MEFMQSIAEIMGREVLHFGGRVLLILLVMMGITFLLRQRWSASRLHTAWTVCLGVALLLPVLYTAFPQGRSIDVTSLKKWVEQISRGGEEERAASFTEKEETFFSDLFAPAEGGYSVKEGEGFSRSLPKAERETSLLSPTDHKINDFSQDTQLPSAVLSPVVREEEGSAVKEVNFWYVWVGGVWFLGVGGLATLYLVGRWRLWVITRRASRGGYGIMETVHRVAQSLKVSKPIRVFFSPEVEIPMTYAISRPVLLLPASLEKLAEEEQELIVKHELIHVKRGDAFAVLLGHVALLLHWMNPFMWWVVLRKMEELREYSCDNWVIEEEQKVKKYAQLLMDYAKRLFEKRQLVGGAMPMAQQSGIEKRIMYLIKGTANRRRDGRRTKALVSGLVGLLFLPMVGLKLSAEIKRFSQEKEMVYFQGESGSSQKREGLSGQLQSIKEGVVSWNHPDIKKEVKLDLRAIQSMEFAPAERGMLQQQGRQHATVVLHNGDEIVGEVLSLKEKELILQTADIGKVRIQRDSIERIEKGNTLGKRVYAGPSHKDEWLGKEQKKSAEKYWEYKKGTLFFGGGEIDRVLGESGQHVKLGSEGGKSRISLKDEEAATLAREVLPGGSFMVSFDVELPPYKYSGIRVFLGGKEGYLLEYFYSSGVAWVELKQRVEGGEKTLWKGDSDEFKKKKIRCEIYYNHQKQEIHLYANGEKILLKRGKYEVPLSITSRMLCFQGMVNREIVLKNIRVYEWAGSLSEEKECPLREEQDYVVMHGGRHLTGHIEAIGEGRLLLKLINQEKQSIALREVGTIYFQNKAIQERKWQQAELTFLGGTKLGMKLIEMEEGRFRGKVDSVEEALIFEKNAVQKIVFNRSTVQQKGERDSIELRNGDRLSGEVQEIRKGELVWSGGPLLKKISIALPYLKKLERAPLPEEHRGYASYVRLKNGDVLGGMRSLKEKDVLLDPCYGDKVEINREQVRDILLAKKEMPFVIYEGPYHVGEWRRVETGGKPQPSFIFKDGALYLQGLDMITKKIETTNKVSLEFTMDWTRKLGLRIILFAGNKENTLSSIFASSRYEILFPSFRPGEIKFIRYKQEDIEKEYGHLALFGKQRGGEVIAPIVTMHGIAEKEIMQMKVGIYVDKEKKEITLAINDKVIRTWQDPDGEINWGNVIGFQSQYRKSPATPLILRLKNLKISHWDGVLPRKDEEEKLTQDIVFLQNDDRIEGKVRRIEKGKVSIQVDGLDESIEIPLHQVRRVALQGEKGKSEKEQKGDVQIIFRDGGKVTMKVEELKKMKLRGAHHHFGKGEFDFFPGKRDALFLS